MTPTAGENIAEAAAAATGPDTLSQAGNTSPPRDKMSLGDALASLDPENDEHWTKDGLPSMHVVEDLIADASITRAQLVEQFPEFNRDKARELHSALEDDTIEEAAIVADAKEAAAPRSLEDRLAAVEADLIFLRTQFGWPTR